MRTIAQIILATWLLTFFSCGSDESGSPNPTFEDKIEIDSATLFFVPLEGDPIVVIALDPSTTDNAPFFFQEGFPNQDDIVLEGGLDYVLNIRLGSTDDGSDLTEDLMEKGDEYRFFFMFDEMLFSIPFGDGNFDDPEGMVGYVDLDENNVPVGFSTTWEVDPIGGGFNMPFHIRLVHFADTKSSTSTIDDGETILDLKLEIDRP